MDRRPDKNAETFHKQVIMDHIISIEHFRNKCDHLSKTGEYQNHGKIRIKGYTQITNVEFDLNLGL